MKKACSTHCLTLVCLMCLLLLFPAISRGAEKLQIELCGGLSYINPKDFNLLSKAEQQYNDIYFIDHLRGMQGYFVNDFPEITMPLQAGFRLKYWMTKALSFSIGWEGFYRRRELVVEGTFSYDPSWYEIHTKKYDPFRMGLMGYGVTGGISFRIPVGELTDLEIGAAAGWAFAKFDFSSTWSYTSDYYYDDTWNFYAVDGGSLEGDGSGNGFLARGNVRFNRMLGKRFGFFIETSGTYCRMKSIEGTGRETRVGIPADKTWEGIWGIKKEEIEMYWETATVFVPTNYWEGWTAEQRDRDFFLDLSGVRLVFGILFKF